MRKIVSNFIFIYCSLISLFILISTAFATQNNLPIVFVFLFLPVAGYFLVEFFRRDPEKKMLPREGELIFVLIIFTILFGIALRNVLLSSKNQNKVLPTPTSALIFKSQTEAPSPTPLETITVKINDGSESINIRAKATIYSDKVGEAKNGDTYTQISYEAGWYKVKLDNGEGYISSIYIDKK